MTDTLLTVRELRLATAQHHILKGIDLDIKKGDIVAIVGESGSGKTATALCLTNLFPHAIACPSYNQLLFEGRRMNPHDDDAFRRLRGRKIGMIFQEPMHALNPLHTIGKQISEVLLLDQKMTRSQALAKTTSLLTSVGITPVEKEYSNGPISSLAANASES